MITFKNLIWQYKKTLGILLGIIFAVTGLSLLVPNLVGTLVGSIEKNNILWPQLWFLGLVSVILFGLEIIQIIIGAKFREVVGFDLRKTLMDKLITQSYTKINQIGIGQVLTLFGNDIDNVKNIMAGELINSIKAILIFFGALIFLFATSWQLGLIAMMSLPLIAGAFGYIFSSISKYFKLSSENQSNLNTAVSQNIYGSSLIRIQNSSAWEIAKFEKLLTQSKEIGYKLVSAFSALIPIINTVANWTTFGIIYFGALSYISGKIQLGDINAYISYYALLTAPIFIIGFNSQGIARLGVSLKRLNEILENQDQIVLSVSDFVIQKSIKLENISLILEQKQVLKNINFEIKLGTKTAILGPTGAGKSQLINILIGVTKPTNGKILIDNLENVEKQNIAVVFQESLIFSGDIRQNILLDREFDKQKYRLATETATIENLANRQTAELGNNLSGGQKQRLTLARAIYDNPQILLLDDFTARVDAKTQEQINQNLAQNYPNTTIVSVTQNIDPIKHFDQIIVLMEGELLGIGTHLELLKTCPEYLQIYQSQQIL